MSVIALDTKKLAAERRFDRWLMTAPAGESFEYYRGFLVVDTGPGKKRADPDKWADANAVGAAARLAHQQGLVDLVQRRIGPNEFGYLAVRRGGA